jgi:hypothetical protein
MRGRRDDMSRLIAQLAANYLQAQGKGDLPSTEVIAAIISNDLLASYGLDAVKAHLQGLQGQKIVTTGMGVEGTFEVKRAGNAYRVTFT